MITTLATGVLASYLVELYYLDCLKYPLIYSVGPTDKIITYSIQPRSPRLRIARNPSHSLAKRNQVAHD
jgi:hypothetical protein